MLLAVVPAYNEENRIARVLRELITHVDCVVVVDDGSVDRTAAVAKSLGVVVLSHRINRGQGAALETGHAYARAVNADYVVHFDADGQFDVNDIPRAHKALVEAKADVLFGSRFLDTRSHIPMFKRYVLFPIARIVHWLFTGLYVRDAHNGFRILNRSAIAALRLTQDRMAHATEIHALVRKHALAQIEFPVRVVYREYGQGAGGGVRIVKDLLVGKFLDG